MTQRSAAKRATSHPDTKGIVRDMGVDDIDKIMEIEKISFVDSWSEKMFEEIIFSPISRGFIVEHDKELVGYTVFYAVDVEAHIMNLAVNPAKRKQGYGRQLLTHAIAFLKENNISECYLEVREQNRDAQMLYNDFGFEVIGRRKRYYAETGEDALVMQLLL
ncbi:MAG: ribosomal-protein-alanine N-acetyltransferase [Syntrophus sp. (in: bacteria)]|nr:ribosomal-protein-alanine N-acetyltransferase [Syntrophus sp. (in: bacteria)]